MDQPNDWQTMIVNHAAGWSVYYFITESITEEELQDLGNVNPHETGHGVGY